MELYKKSDDQPARSEDVLALLFGLSKKWLLVSWTGQARPPFAVLANRGTGLTVSPLADNPVGGKLGPCSSFN
jgi:hypothetical protein